MQRNHRRAEAGFGHHFRFRIVLLDRGVVRIDLGLRFRDRRARFQSRDHVRDAAARVARFRSTLFHIGFYRKKNARLGREKTKSRRQKASVKIMTFFCAAVSSSVKLRPITGLIPRVVKNSGEMRTISSCCMEPGSPTVSALSIYMERLEKAGRLPRRS